MSTSPRTLTVPVLALLAFASLAAASGCAADTESAGSEPSADEATADGKTEQTGTTSAALRIRGGLGANGDACTVRTNPDGTKVPGTEKDGECCSNADTTDCVIILKPFPSWSYSFTY